MKSKMVITTSGLKSRGSCHDILLMTAFAILRGVKAAKDYGWSVNETRELLMHFIDEGIKAHGGEINDKDDHNSKMDPG